MKKINKQLNKYIHWNEFNFPSRELINFSKSSFFQYREKITPLIFSNNSTSFLWENAFKFYSFEDNLSRLEQNTSLLSYDEQKKILEYTQFTNELSAKIFDYIIVTSLSEARLSHQLKDIYEKLEEQLIKGDSFNYLYKLSESEIKKLFTPEIKEFVNNKILAVHQKIPHISIEKISTLYEQVLYTCIKDPALDRDDIQDFWTHPVTSKMLQKLNVKEVLEITHSLLDAEYFNSGFGGKFWQNIVNHAINFCDGKINLNTFLDQSFSMEHNSGSMFNKNYLFKQFTKKESYIYSIDVFTPNLKKHSFNFTIDEFILNAQRHSSVLTLLQKYEPVSKSTIKKHFPNCSIKQHNVMFHSFNSIITTLNEIADTISSKTSSYLNRNKIQLNHNHIVNLSKIFFNDLDIIERSYGTNSEIWSAIKNSIPFISQLETILSFQSIEKQNLSFSIKSLSDLSKIENSPQSIGNKGFGLVEMKKLNIPVPDAFIIDTSTNISFIHNPNKIMEKLAHSFKEQINPNFDLFSIRSGAAISMPGVLDTILNVGIDDTTYHNLSDKYGPKVIEQCAIKFMQTFSKSLFDETILDSSISETLNSFCSILKKNKIQYNENTIFPLTVEQQFLLSCKAVFQSSSKPIVREFCLHNDQPLVSTAIIIQKMILGNFNKNSLTGVIFSKNCSDGSNKIWGEYLINTQGEDLVSGKTMATNIDQLEKTKPKIYQELSTIAQQLEKHFNAIQDIEFTVENNQLYILQTRNAKISSNAQKQLLKNGDIQFISHQVFDKFSSINDSNKPDIKGLSIGMGALSGIIIKNEHDFIKYKDLKNNNNHLIFYAEQGLPEHLPMMLKTDAILTKEGGMTSHAAILARNLKKPAISGIPNIFKSGDIISLDATKGFIWKSFQNVTQPNEKENLKVAKNILKHFHIDTNSITSVKQNFLQNMQSWHFELNDNYKKISSKKHFFQLMEKAALLTLQNHKEHQKIKKYKF